MKTAAIACLLLVGVALANVPAPAVVDPPVAAATSETTPLRAVMFELEYDGQGFIRHAQVVGGYATMSDCQEALVKVMGVATSMAEAGTTPQLQCTGVKAVERQEKKAAAEGGKSST